ncbi:MAG: hypothetical protein JSW58_02230 [Candidatus Latescibacterota bacterium]|nr:MAG: hypothetical protein JSW58_02230 [Candidatus Latescibacterota bacterium]
MMMTLTRRKRRKAVFAIVGVTLLVGLVFSTVRVQDFRYRPYLHETLYLPSGKFLKEMSLGYRQFVADLVWLSAVQYYGGYRKGNHDLRYFQGLIDLVVTLDPHFIFAYVFGALVVSEDLGVFDDGMAILKHGMSANPTSWELPFEIGFLNYVNRLDNAMAARYLDLASRMPGAPEYTDRFAAFVYNKAGDTDSSIRLWEAYKEHTDSPFLKELAERYIEKIKQSIAREGTASDAQ